MTPAEIRWCAVLTRRSCLRRRTLAHRHADCGRRLPIGRISASHRRSCTFQPFCDEEFFVTDSARKPPPVLVKVRSPVITSEDDASRWAPLCTASP
jgi:hypothetical protein